MGKILQCFAGNFPEDKIEIIIVYPKDWYYFKSGENVTPRLTAKNRPRKRLDRLVSIAGDNNNKAKLLFKSGWKNEN